MHTLLLADDSVTIQRVIELTFADEDIKVVAVGDGDQAIAALQKTPPDIVLADIGMPGRTGYEVAQYIKDTPRLAHIPVVLLTGAFEPVDQKKASSIGCDGVLAKPFEPQLVIGRVKELLAKPRQPAAPAAHAAPVMTSPAAAPPSPAVPSSAPVPAPAPVPPAAATHASIDAPLAPPPGTSKTTTQRGTDDYFDQLDQAFATLTTAGPDRQGKSGARGPVPQGDDWFAAKPPAAAPAPARVAPPAEPAPVASSAVPTVVTPSKAGVDRPGSAAEPAPAKAATAPATAAPAAPAAPIVPPLADAFAALLAAEQAGPAPTRAPVWPASASTAAPIVPDMSAITGELVEQVTRRVLEKMSERAVKAAVADILAETAEWLVREEIEKIKSAIK